ncbi:GNAT family N-acetyltransferase [Arcanobacterium pinnipediorum]|uniref:GNAT family N-acetyltransferase n=1 Tax=Arcanobacterium pinnipediorum TaxID=1503041 RepID=A0ABY5AJK6_9ACTO|nr:GNAT family N-acetyltransferase [Arcanobacterium pinnipediorum]USR80040.1 GNAT family N-acetyltransferase [Arcanobacterium pinnipediorum]
MEIERILWDGDLSRAVELRNQVFIKEQGVPPELEHDERDRLVGTYHVIVSRQIGGPALGTGRIFRGADGRVHIGRVAVQHSVRGLGVGAMVMHELHAIAGEVFADDDAVEVFLSAQLAAVEFYHKLGYEILSEGIYLDAGIEHKDMSIVIPAV